jgi:hypothetical protein
MIETLARWGSPAGREAKLGAMVRNMSNASGCPGEMNAIAQTVCDLHNHIRVKPSARRA